MNQVSKALLHPIEAATGKSVEYLVNTPLDEQWASVERELGTSINCVSMFPLIGHAGSVMRDRVMTHDEAEAEFARARLELIETLRHG